MSLHSVELALEVAQRRRDVVIAALSRIERRRQHALGQMQQLDAYAIETAQRWSPVARERPTHEVLHNYAQFMERLRQTIAMQQGVLDGLAREAGMVQQQLQVAELRLAGLRTLVRSRKAELAQEQHRRDQKHMDEFAMLAHRRRVAQGDSY